jgi:DNA-directed RNA polymerase specialized sigma24 family protein
VPSEPEQDLADGRQATPESPGRRRDRTGKPGPGGKGEHQREALSSGEKLQPPADVIERLDAEWPALAAGPLHSRLRCWALEEPALAGFATTQQLLRHLRGLRGRGDAEDEILVALVRRARVDPQAARVVLQALLPGLKNLAGRLLLEPDEREEIWSALLAHCWERIRRYPLERRPSRIAANVLLDTLQKTTRELKRQRRERDELAGDLSPQQTASPPRGSDVERLLRRAVEATAITEQEAELILRTRIDRTDLRLIAEELQLPYNTLVVRRLRAERRLLLFVGKPAVTSQGSKAPLSSARVLGAGLTGSAGRGAATPQPRRR